MAGFDVLNKGSLLVELLHQWAHWVVQPNENDWIVSTCEQTSARWIRIWFHWFWAPSRRTRHMNFLGPLSIESWIHPCSSSCCRRRPSNNPGSYRLHSSTLIYLPSRSSKPPPLWPSRSRSPTQWTSYYPFGSIGAKIYHITRIKNPHALQVILNVLLVLLEMLCVHDGIKFGLQVGYPGHILNLGIHLDGLNVGSIPPDARHETHHGPSHS